MNTDDQDVLGEDRSQSSGSTPDETIAQLQQRLAACESRLSEVTNRVSHTRHELNNLLTGIFGQVQLLLMREELSPTAKRRIETVEDLAKRLRDTVTHLNEI